MATVPLGLGEVIAGKYRVERLLGAGGMGVVIEATHTELDQRVAIKMLREEGLKDSKARARFALEAKAVVRLKSLHVARVIDVGALENGSPFLVMELLEGADLARTLDERGALPIAEAVAYMLQVCEGVAEAHGFGIIHRDLKPRNLFVTTGVDGKPLLKVLDFGISKFLRPAGSDELALTQTTDVMGSPSYMAPEQLRAARDADERSDIWSLGVILYEIITGRLPWEAKTVTELGAMVLRDAPRLMRELRREVPPDLEQVIFTCLEKEPSKRFGSVAELAHALEPHALGLAPGAADKISSVARTSKQPPSSPSLRDRPSSSSSRVMVSGGTSVSWGETELMPAPKLSMAPRLLSRSGLLALGGVIAVAALGAGGYALATRGASTPAPAAVLPEDRGANRPPSTASASAALPLPGPSGLPVASATATPTSTALIPLASIPRHAPSASATVRASEGPAPATTTTTTMTTTTTATATAGAASSNAAPAAAPDPHNMRSIGRK